MQSALSTASALFSVCCSSWTRNTHQDFSILRKQTQRHSLLPFPLSYKVYNLNKALSENYNLCIPNNRRSMMIVDLKHMKLLERALVSVTYLTGQWGVLSSKRAACMCSVTLSDWGQGWCTFNLLSVSRPLQGLWHIAFVSIIHKSWETFECECPCVWAWKNMWVHWCIKLSSSSRTCPNFFRILFAVIISTVLHNHTVSTTYKLTVTQTLYSHSSCTTSEFSGENGLVS